MSKKIVVIEDDRDIADAIAMMLVESGYTVNCFTAFTDKNELINSSADLFIIDENLPAISGHIICIMLRTNVLTRSIPQILISASPTLRKFAELGEVNASLKKPFAMTELISLVKSLIN